MLDKCMSERTEVPKPHFTIWPEYGRAYLWLNTAGTHSLQGGEYSTKAAALQHGISKRLLSRLDDWQLFYERYAFESTTQRGPRPFDWNAFNAQGVDLAIRLKQELGEKARVFYEKAFDDPNSHLNTRREVLIDGQLVGVE